jgi:hypothetical protein
MSHTALSVNGTEWAGSTFTSSIEAHTFRIAFQNVNSLGTSQYHHNIQDIAMSQHELQIDLIGITEHCLNTSQPKVLNTIQRSLNQHFRGQYVIQMNSSSIETSTPYLPGGTASLLIGEQITRIDPIGRGGDEHGRWSFITLRRKKSTPLTIYTAYKVNKQPTNNVGITAWHQQRIMLNKQNREREHPREAFTTDLIRSIRSHQDQHHHIIVGGDFNDTLYSRRSQLLHLANATQLVDPWTVFYPQFNTYQRRGTSRIDSVLVSHDLVDSIRKIGYSPFNWFTNSDHRTLLINFNTSVLFRDRIDLVTAPQLRGLKSNDRQQIATFVEHCHDHLKNNNVFSKLSALRNRNLTPEQVETVDKLIGQAFQSAEAKCRRRRKPFYSVKLAKLRTLRSITLGNFKALKNGNSKTSIFQQRLTRHGIDFTLEGTLQEAWNQYNSASSELNEALQQNRELRLKEQQAAIETANLQGKNDKEKILRTIAKQEARRSTWQTLRYVRMQQGSRQKLDRLEIPTSWPPPFSITSPTNPLEDPKTCIEWTTITEPDEIEFFLQLQNRLHFGQANGTPFTREPFSSYIPWPADTEYCDNVLAGTTSCTIEDVPQISALLQGCKAASELNVLPTTITEREFRDKITSWKETTSTSPSGRHLGFYRSLFAPGPYLNDTGDDEENNRYNYFRYAQQDIAQLILEIINYCLETGYILERWKTIVNIMIFKEPGIYKIHKLRVIHIYEADFNLLLTVKWRQLLQHADQQNLLNPGLFGGRPGCEAQSLPFLEELKYDVSYTTQRTLINFDNDATSCYDRIIVALASLVNRKYGLHRSVVLVHASTLQQARFHLRTQLP